MSTIHRLGICPTGKDRGFWQFGLDTPFRSGEKMVDERMERRNDVRDPLLTEEEDHLTRSPEGFSYLSGKTPAEIIHELQVHQIELDIQNEELKKTQIDLEEIRDRYLDIFDFAPVGYFILTDEALIAEANLTGAAMLGIERKSLIQDRFRRYVASDQTDQWDHFFLTVLHHEEQNSCRILLKRRDQSVFSTRIIGKRMEKSGEPTQVRIAISDISEQKKAEDELRESEEKFRLVVESAPDAIFIQTEGRFAYVNPAACRIFGASSTEQLVGVQVADLFHPEFPKIVWERIRIQDEDLQPVPRIEESIIRLDGAAVDVEVSAVSVRYSQKDGTLVFARNVSQRKHAEDIIRTTLEEKEILLREVHHRVKNNLAVIISLIEMQSDLVTDKKTQELLTDLESRVMTIALVHESLYNTENIAHINFEEYLARLIRQIIHSLNYHQDLKIIMEIEPISVGLDVAIPCGLIINELITNSLKYAFPGGTPPEDRKNTPCTISVIFRHSGDYLCLKVCDNGVGFKDEKNDWLTAKTLGLQIVSMLASHQLRGSIELDSRKGTIFSILFKEPEKKGIR